MIEYAHAAGWKHKHAHGIRFFSSASAAQKVNSPATSVADFFVQWPAALGPTPTLEDLERWLEEYNAAHHQQQST